MLRAAPLPRVVARASVHAPRRRPPLCSSRARARGGVRLPTWWVAAHRTATQAPCASHQLATAAREVQKASCTQPCCRLRLEACPQLVHCRESKRQQRVPALRAVSASATGARQSTLKHALPWHNNATRRPLTSKSCSARFTQEQHAVDAPRQMSRAALAMQSARLGRLQRTAVPTPPTPCADWSRRPRGAPWAVLIAKVFTLDAYTRRADVVVVVGECCVFSERCRSAAPRRRGGSSAWPASTETKRSSETKKTK